MKIESISLYNYRSLVKTENIKLYGFDVFIGQNDSGKSSVLKALNNFFNPKEELSFERDGAVKTDLSNKAILHNNILGTGSDILPNEIGILLEFSLNESDLLNTENLYIKNSLVDNKLFILKKGGIGGAKYYILISNPVDENYRMLGDKKEKGLKELYESRKNIFEQFLVNENGTGKPTNSEYIKAIMLGLRDSGESFTNNIIESKDIVKDPIFPSFVLMESHGSIDGTNKIIDSAFKLASDRIVETHKQSDEFKNFRRTIEGKYNQITGEICEYAKEKYLHDLISIQANPIINFTVTKELLIQKESQGKASHFDNQGDGTKRRIMVAMLQTGSKLIEIANNENPYQESIPTELLDNKSTYQRPTIWAFDEPELHLHPGAQRDLFESLKTFKDNGTQIICSTHSTIFVDRLNFNGTHLFKLSNEGTTTVNSENNGPEELLTDLGIRNSDVFFASKIILVEGETEEHALPIFYKHIKGKDLNDDGVEIICTKGSSRLSEIAEVILLKFNNSYALIDKDSKDKVASLDFTGRIGYIGEHADFEDAFNLDTWTELLNNNYTVTDSEFVWNKELLSNFISEIDVGDSNKKLLKRIENQYKKEWKESHGGEVNFDKSFNKPEIGELLAKLSIQRNEIPQEISKFINSL